MKPSDLVDNGRRQFSRLARRVRIIGAPGALPADSEVASPEMDAAAIDLRDNQLMSAVFAATLAPDACAIDVGAHQGAVLRELVRCAPQGRFIAVEPLPQMASALREQFPSVEVHEAALSDKPGKLTFNHIIDMPAYSGLRVRTLPDGDHPVEELTVKVERLDDIVPEDFRVSLIKIDVEGGELGVLRGARQTLLRDRPIVIFEHGIGAPEPYGTTSGDIHDVLVGECAMRIYDLTGRGPYSRDEFESLFAAPIWNFIARP